MEQPGEKNVPDALEFGRVGPKIDHLPPPPTQGGTLTSDPTSLTHNPRGRRMSSSSSWAKCYMISRQVLFIFRIYDSQYCLTRTFIIIRRSPNGCCVVGFRICTTAPGSHLPCLTTEYDVLYFHTLPKRREIEWSRLVFGRTVLRKRVSST